MWRMLMLSMLALAIAGLFYIVSRIHRLSLIVHISEGNPLLGWLCSLLPLGLIGLFALINITTMIVVMLHVVAAFLICDIFGGIARLFTRKKLSPDILTAAAVGMTVIYLGVGWFMAHHVFITRYEITTNKDLGEEALRIVAFADSHLGITLDGKSFSKQMERIDQLKPDAVVIVGDFVDDDSDIDDMIEACRALGRLETSYGVYFVYGNHDDGYFNYRNFTSQQLRDNLTQNGVTILEDKAALVAGSFYIVGRRDRSMPGRASMAALASELVPDRYSIVLEHQPNDYANEAAEDVDLVISGHTHGGHIFPAGPLSLAIGANDKVYGREERNGTTFIVTSGISGWAIPFKTGTFSEIVVLDITSD